MRAWLLCGLLLPSCFTPEPRPDTDARVVARDAGPELRCAAPGSARDGAPCACALDCAEGALCVSELESGQPGGACLRTCDPAAAPPGCPPETLCASRSGAPTGLCLRACEGPDDCDPGRVCARGLCLGLCASDSECLSGRCDAHLGLCTDGSPRAGLGTFAPCVRDDECLSGFCAPDLARCATSCALSRPGCPAGEVCVEDADPDDLGACVPRCPSSGVCGAGLRCLLTATPEGTARVCAP